MTADRSRSRDDRSKTPAAAVAKGSSDDVSSDDASGEEVIVTLPADVKCLGTVRRVVEAAAQSAGLPADHVYEVVLAVHEACANVIQHAYAGRPGGTFTVACHRQPGGLEVRVRDQGKPFDIQAAAELPPDELREGGRGVFLIRRLMDEVDSRRGADGANELRLFRRTHSK